MGRVSPIPNDGAGIGTRTDSALTPGDAARAEQLREWLERRARGKDRGRSVAQLADVMHVSARKVRTLITALREGGVPICGTPETGYFWPANAEEAESTLAFLEARLHSTESVRNGIRRGLGAIDEPSHKASKSDVGREGGGPVNAGQATALSSGAADNPADGERTGSSTPRRPGPAPDYATWLRDFDGTWWESQDGAWRQLEDVAR